MVGEEGSSIEREGVSERELEYKLVETERGEEGNDQGGR